MPLTVTAVPSAFTRLTGTAPTVERLGTTECTDVSLASRIWARLPPMKTRRPLPLTKLSAGAPTGLTFFVVSTTSVPALPLDGDAAVIAGRGKVRPQAVATVAGSAT